MGKLVGCFTSTPHSVKHVKRTLDSIMTQSLQLDVIYYFYPRYSHRFDMEYPPMTLDAAQYPNVQMIRTEDVGPNTKIAPLLDLKSVGPDDSIIIFDDDTVYNSNAVQKLVNAASPHSGVGFCGHTFAYVPFQMAFRHALPSRQNDAWYNRVRVLLCQGMVLYPRSMFPQSTQEYKDIVATLDCLHLNDDHVMAHLAYAKGIPLYLVSLKETTYTHNIQRGALSGTNATAKCEMRMMVRGLLPLPWIEIATVLIGLVLLTQFVVHRVYGACKQQRAYRKPTGAASDWKRVKE